MPTPTASGKTLCYNLPVLDSILRDGQSRALYLFPTKALSQDQMHEVHGIVTDLGVDIKTYTFDGDTPETARRAIRSSGHIVVTNPDLVYLRLHGRNSRGWRSGSMQKQFDYDYSETELKQTAALITGTLMPGTRTGAVFFNNHVRGQAPKNCLRLGAIISSR